ncbi:hypothetical protein KIL84_011788 [Mauremys mutica]|uniref:Uncharacterized protein n=1 Tax=Mauremys mutica TaxID=74926 RepID=A0A9D3XEA3_9SAUR|nr:hypothetical protein KIL84_011788 [Mauremys mutica]
MMLFHDVPDTCPCQQWEIPSLCDLLSSDTFRNAMFLTLSCSLQPARCCLNSLENKNLLNRGVKYVV